MEPSSEQHNHDQEMGSQTLESMLACTKAGQVGKKPRPADMQALKCPRCESSNTKFCYYNNYSLSQPRYFCKSCRRYWTKGGTLRNVPVGGGCRKSTKRSSTSSSSSASKRLTQLDPHHPMLSTSSHPLPPYDPTGDLSLAIARLHKQNPALGEPESLSIWGGHHLGPPLDGGLLGDSSVGRNNNMYCGGMGGGVHEMGLPFGDFGSGMKPDNRGIMWGGFPWQGAGGDGNGADLNPGRALGWSGLGSSTWHGLLNSPLM